MRRSIAHPFAAPHFSEILLVALACSTHAPLRSAPASIDRISVEQIAASEAITAYEAIQRIRPRLLTSTIDLSPQSERRVYLDGVRIGGIDQLRWIPAMTVREIRFVRSVEGGGGGTDASGAAIIVLSKNGR